MAKELKGGLETAEADEPEQVAAAAQPGTGEGPGLNEEILYAKPEGDGAPVAKPADGADDKPKASAKSKADEDEEEDEDLNEGEEADEPDDAGKAQAWDKDRQRRDEEHARERRELQGQAEAAAQANQALAEEIRALREGRETAASAAEDREVEEALARVDALSDLSEPAEIVAAVKAVKRLSLRAPKGGADAERVEKIEQALQSLAESVRGLGEATAVRQGREELEGAMAELDGEFGAEFHNDALEVAGQYLLKQGRTLENPPTLAEKRIALRLAYTELKAGKKPAKGGKPKPKPAVSSDAGRGGGLEAGGLKRGSLRDVARDMQKEGKLQG